MNKGIEAKIQGKPNEKHTFLVFRKGETKTKNRFGKRNSNFERAIRNWSPNRLKIGPFWDPKVVQNASYWGTKLDAKKYTFKKK